MFSFIYIALRVPLFDKFATRTNLRMVKAEMQTQSVKILEIEKTLKTEALKIKTDLINLQQKVITANLSVVAHKEAFRFSTEKFNAGKISVYEHLQAKQKLANSQSQSVQESMNWLINWLSMIIIIIVNKNTPLFSGYTL